MGADLVAVDHRHFRALGDVGDHAVAQLRLAGVVGRGRDVDYQLAFPREITHRILSVADAGELRAPDVLADGQPDALAGNGDDAGLVAGTEVALLVEYIVGRQQALVIAGDDLAARDGDERVGERRPRAGFERLDAAEERGQWQLAREVLHQPPLAFDEPTALQQIARRIAAAGRQLRTHQQVSAFEHRLVRCRADRRRRAIEIADQEVELGQGDAHGASSWPGSGGVQGCVVERQRPGGGATSRAWAGTHAV